MSNTSRLLWLFMVCLVSHLPTSQLMASTPVPGPYLWEIIGNFQLQEIPAGPEQMMKGLAKYGRVEGKLAYAMAKSACNGCGYFALKFNQILEREGGAQVSPQEIVDTWRGDSVEANLTLAMSNTTNRNAIGITDAPGDAEKTAAWITDQLFEEEPAIWHFNLVSQSGDYKKFYSNIVNVVKLEGRVYVYDLPAQKYHTELSTFLEEGVSGRRLGGYGVDVNGVQQLNRILREKIYYPLGRKGIRVNETWIPNELVTSKLSHNGRVSSRNALDLKLKAMGRERAQGASCAGLPR